MLYIILIQLAYYGLIVYLLPFFKLLLKPAVVIRSKWKQFMK